MNCGINDELQRICNIFRIKGKWRGYEEIKVGHINNTYKVCFVDDNGEEKKYMVQKINMYVFKNPRYIMKNIDLITNHIRRKNDGNTLHFHHTDTGENYFVDSGGFWRIYTFIDGVTIDGDQSERGMFFAGKAFGDFQIQLADFDATCLKETIPDFHNTKKRLLTLFHDGIDDPCGRVDFAEKDIGYVQSVRKLAVVLTEMTENGDLPIRVTHNDTKTNNVLVDRDTLEPKVVIDLDTVMPGIIAHDFGDAIRYGANTAAEDEKDLSKVSINMTLFKAFSEGFIGKVARILTPKEVETLALGAVIMTLECGIRFLDDYITGDQYFRISYPEHNLVRARCQFALAKDMINHLEEMNCIVNRIYEDTMKSQTV